MVYEKKVICGVILSKRNALQWWSKVDASFYKSGSFSKFYLEIDNESPGQVGGWIGWQIVRRIWKQWSIFATISRFKC
jgi:hypothetical protein